MPSESETLYKTIHPVKYFRDYLAHEIRPDGRKLTAWRPMQVNVDSIGTADGSATVKVGNTTVVCGIKVELAPPEATRPDQGFLVPNIELTPLCAARFRPGAPSEEAQVTSQALAEIIDSAACVDLKSLCIVKERLAFSLFCDVVCVDHDGSVLDAAVVALTAALKTLQLPKIEYNTDTTACSVDDEGERWMLEVKGLPVATTFMIFDGKIVVDPTGEEEKLSAATLTIVICDSELSYVYKPGGVPVDPEHLETCIKLAVSREKAVKTLLDSVISNKN